MRTTMVRDEGGGTVVIDGGGGEAVGGNVVTYYNRDNNDWDVDDGDDAHAPGFADAAPAVGHAKGEHVIGPGENFITAPEKFQRFGEWLLVWLMTQYCAMRSPSEIQVVEVSLGKGTLMCDIVRSAIATFPYFALAEGRRLAGTL
jgi:hypothetical protein